MKKKKKLKSLCLYIKTHPYVNKNFKDKDSFHVHSTCTERGANYSQILLNLCMLACCCLENKQLKTKSTQNLSLSSNILFFIEFCTSSCIAVIEAIENLIGYYNSVEYTTQNKEHSKSVSLFLHSVFDRIMHNCRLLELLDCAW